MREHSLVLFMVCAAVILVGAANTAYQLFKMVAIDATARGLKHPKFWGFWAMNGNNSSGLVLYLIGRRNYPILNMSETEQKEISSRKKKAGVGLLFLVVGALGFIVWFIA